MNDWTKKNKPGVLCLTDVAKVQQAIDDYFASRIGVRTFTGKDGTSWEEEYLKPYTMAGLARALGTTRQTLLAYGKGEGTRDPALVPIIAAAKNRIAEYAEEALFYRESSSGAQFALRVNHGYDDKGDEGTGEGFEMNVIPPAASDDALAIPVWGEEMEDD